VIHLVALKPWGRVKSLKKVDFARLTYVKAVSNMLGCCMVYKTSSLVLQIVQRAKDESKCCLRVLL